MTASMIARSNYTIKMEVILNIRAVVFGDFAVELEEEAVVPRRTFELY